MHRVGEFEISRVVEMEVPFVDAGAFLPDSIPDVIQANADWLMPGSAAAARQGQKGSYR